MAEPARPSQSRWSALRIVSWIFVVFILVIVAFIVAILQPSVQQRILERQLIKAGAHDIHLAGIHVTPFGFRADQVGFVQGGLRLDASGVDLKIHPGRLLSHEVNIENFSGQRVDVSVDVAGAVKSSQAKREGAPAKVTPANPFPVQLPWKVIVEKFDVGGKFTARLGVIQLESGQWHLSGGGLAPGASATVRYELRPDPPATIRTGGGKIFGTLEIPESTDGKIISAKLALQLEAVPLAWANQVVNPKGVQILDGQLSGKVLASADHEGATVLPGTGLQVTGLKVEKINSVVHLNRAEGTRWAIELLRPYRIDPVNPLAPLEAGANADWAHVTLGNVPLEAAAPWIPGRQLSGTWVKADAVVRYLAGKGVTLTATAPWEFADVAYSAGGQEWFHGSLAVSPVVLYSADTQWVRFTALTASDRRGYKVAAHGGVVLKGKEDQVAGGITLQATLPFFPGLPEKTGPYGVGFSATAHILPDGKNTLSKFTATITGKAGEVLANVAAGQPITVEQSPTGEWLVSSPQPLLVKTAAVPLSGIESLFQARGLKVGGIIPATEFALWFSPRHFRLEPKTPLAVQRFHLERQNEVLIDRALLRFTPALDLEFEHRLLPAFQFKASTSLSIKSGVIAVDGHRVGLFDFQLDAAGTEKSVVPKNLQGGLWLDLGALGQTGLLSHMRLPAKGEFRLEFGRSTTEPKYIEFQGGLARVTGHDGKEAPSLDFLGRAQGDFAQKEGGFGVTATILPVPSKANAHPRPTAFHFGFKLDFQQLALLDISSRLNSDFVNLDDVRALESAFSPAVIAAPKGAGEEPAQRENANHAPPGLSVESAPWGIVRGHFTLGIKELSLPPYTIKNLAGKLELSDTQIALTGVTGETLGGKWAADCTAGIQPANHENPVALKAHFSMTQIDAAQAVHLRYPDPPAGVDGKVNLEVTIAGQSKTWEDLAAATTGQFVMTATGGRMHLVLPKKDMISNALILGGTFTFSKELRALGRFVKTLENLPVNQIRTTGTLAKDGHLQIETMTLDSPQIRLTAVGEVANAKTRDLMGEPLEVHASLAATGDIAVMLGGMNLLNKGPDGSFRKMKEPFLITGNVGQPNLQPLYDLLARAVDSSHGSWGMLMRKVQAMVPKTPPKAAPKTSS
jgi:hypothetical protein